MSLHVLRVMFARVPIVFPNAFTASMISVEFAPTALAPGRDLRVLHAPMGNVLAEQDMVVINVRVALQVMRGQLVPRVLRHTPPKNPDVYCLVPMGSILRQQAHASVVNAQL